jgi:serine/threonine-protein kinase
MIATETRSWKAFVKDLLTYNLITSTQLPVLQEYLRQHPGASARDLADHCVARSLLTRFQADTALEAGAQELVLWVYTLTDYVNPDQADAVYKAYCKTDKQTYTLRTFPRRNVVSVPKVARQLKAFKEFRHPAVVPIVHVGTAGDRHYLVWPHTAAGETLEALVARRGSLPPKEAVALALQVARGLQACHEHELFHGLLKPAEIVLAKDNTCCILNFGIGFLLSIGRKESLIDTANTTQQVAEGVDCACPESLLDTTVRTPLSDQYSLGCILYYCLAGRFPFAEGSQAEKMLAHLQEEPKRLDELNPKVPAALAEVVARMLQKEPAQRYPDMGAVAAALQGALARPAGARPAATPAPATKQATAPARKAPVGESPTKPEPKAPPAAAPKQAAGVPPPASSWKLWVGSGVGALALAAVTWWLLR